MEFLKRHKLLVFGLATLVATVAYAAGFERIPKDKLILGTGTTDSKVIESDVGLGAANPKLRFNSVSPTLEFASDGVSFLPFGSGSGGSAGINVLTNGDFELGVTSNWVASGGTLADEEGGDVLNGTKSATWTPSGASQTLTSDAGTIPAVVGNQACLATFWYKDGDSSQTAQVLDGGSAVIGQRTLTTQAEAKQEFIPFLCPAAGSTVTFRLISTGAATEIFLDDVFVGTKDRVRKSLQIAGVDDPDASIAGGGVRLSDGRVLKTYDGTGTTSQDYGKQLTIDLDTVLGASPADATTYSLCVDKDLLGSSVTLTDTGEKVVALEEAQFALLTEALEDTLSSRYLCLGYIRSATTGTEWDGPGSTFDDYPRDSSVTPPVTVNPIIFSQTQTMGTVGAVANAQGAVEASDLTGNFAIWTFAGDVLDSSGQNECSGPCDLTTISSPPATFTGTGFFGRENLPENAGDFAKYESSDAFFGQTGSVTFGAWYNAAWTQNLSSFLLEKDAGSPQRGYQFSSGNAGDLECHGSYDGTSLVIASFDASDRSLDDKWIHITCVVDTSDNEVRMYIDGALVSSTFDASLTTLNASTSNFQVGDDASGSPVRFTMQDVFFADSALTSAQINAIYSKRFTNTPQLAGGHVLDVESFPTTANTYFWNLNANANDSSGNGKNLTVSGSVPFTGSNIFGGTGSAVFSGSSGDYVSSTDAVFNPGDTDHAFGAWFKVNWESDSDVLIGQQTSASERASTLQTSGGDLRCQGSTDGSSFDFERYNLGWNDGEWHHVVFKYNATTNTISCYGDGQPVGSFDLTGGMHSSGDAEFEIGATFKGTTSVMAGLVEQAFFVAGDLSDESIRKLAGSRLDLSRSTPVTDQEWLGSYTREDSQFANEMDKGWILDKREQSLYLKPDLAAGDVLEIKQRDNGFSATMVPVQKFNATYSSDPCAGSECSINHLLPGRPSNVDVWFEVNVDEWERQDPATCQATVTTLICDFSGLPTIDGSSRLNVLASMSDLASAFEGDPVTSGAQVFSGPKLFNNTISATNSAESFAWDRGNTGVMGAIGYDGSEIDMYIGSVTNHAFQLRVNDTARALVNVDGEMELAVPDDAACGIGTLCSNDGDDTGGGETCVSGCTSCIVTGLKYARTGGVTHFSFAVTLDPSVSSGVSECRFNPPFLQAFSAADDAVGTCNMRTSGQLGYGIVQADSSNNDLLIRIQDVPDGIARVYACTGMQIAN